ncbi:tetratricopeptide repeat protein [Candidatus Dependentiae bacterium]|nr:tetratricopeptide repeat protein [Candidatus Dependentiae bacterium]
MSMRKKKKGILKKNSNSHPKIKLSENSLQNIFIYKILPPSLLFLLTSIFYWPSLKYPFQFDDLANITKKFAIRFDNPLYRWWHNSRWMGDWLNRMNYQLGQFDPFYYRIFNLFIHICTGLILFYLILSLCKFLKSHPFFYNNATLIAFTTSALFLFHPVQTQTVSYVIQGRLEGLATLFVVVTLFLFIKTFSTKNKILKPILLVSTIVIALLSCGTKEIVVVTPFLLLLIDWFFLSQENWNSFKTRIGFHAIFFITFFVIFVHYLSPEFFTRAVTFKTSTSNNRGNILTKSAYDTITPYPFLISEFKVILHYLLIFLWPFNISVEYDWKLSESFFSFDSFFPFIILITIIALCIYAVVKKKYSYISFGFFWFFISIAPRSSIIPSPELICDYKTYLASIGWLFVLSVALIHLIKFAFEKIHQIPSFMHGYFTQLILITVLLSGFGIGTTNRNIIWSSAAAFWKDIVNKAPTKARGHNNLGVALSEEGKTDEAIIHYKKAIQLDRNYADPLSNLAVAYSMKGEIDNAIAALKGAIHIFPTYAEAYNNLGTLLLKKQNYEDAEKMLNAALEIRPYYGKAFYNLGRLYAEKNDLQTAWTYFKKATEGDLDIAEGFFTLGQVSIRIQKFDEAVQAFEKVIQKGVQTPQVLFGLANSYYMTQNFDKAQAVYEKLVQLEPLNSKYLYNLAETLFSKNEIQAALNLFKKVTTMPEALAQAHLRIVTCYEQLNQIDDAKNYLTELTKVDAPDEFKDSVKKELARLEFQSKVNQGQGSVKMSDLQKYVKTAAPKKQTQDLKTA